MRRPSARTPFASLTSAHVTIPTRGLPMRRRICSTGVASRQKPGCATPTPCVNKSARVSAIVYPERVFCYEVRYDCGQCWFANTTTRKLIFRDASTAYRAVACRWRLCVLTNR
eukprot:7420117-Pyramimonas_sp.AAC.1